MDEKITELFKKIERARGEEGEIKIISETRLFSQEREELLESNQRWESRSYPSYIINGRRYIVGSIPVNEDVLRSALKELDKELSSIDFLQPLPDETIVHPLEGIIEGENLFVTRRILGRSPEDTIVVKPPKQLLRVIEKIRNSGGSPRV